MDPKDYKESRNVLFLLGAGASAEFGLPVMSRFLSVAQRRFFDRRDASKGDDLLRCYSGMLDFQRRCRNSSWTLDRDWDNIEELYTQADLLRLAEKPTKHDSEDFCRDIAWVLWDVYRRCSIEHNTWPNVVKECKAGGFAPIILTTNYDLVCETSLGWESVYYHGFGNPLPRDSFVLERGTADDDKRRDRVPVIKLHGSVNWFSQMESGETSWIAYLKDLGSSELSRRELREDIHGLRPGPHGWLPGIIPPMLGKASQDSLFALQWKEAIKAIAGARLIIVVGYSFPVTDAFMSRLLTEGLADNHDFDLLAVIDQASPEDHAIRRLLANRLRSTRFTYVQRSAIGGLALLAGSTTSNWEQNLRANGSR